jgi:pimeloyl-ACP methyl ester carboxylesterase
MRHIVHRFGRLRGAGRLRGSREGDGGGSGSLGDFVAANAREYASDVTGVVVPDSGHWIYEERPSELIQVLLDFL